MYKFSWEDVITNEVPTLLWGATGLNADERPESIRRLIVTICENEGGFSVSPIQLTDNDLYQISLQLVDDAVKRAFREDTEQLDWPGFVLEDSESQRWRAVQRPRIAINSATAVDLDDLLPGVGESRAKSIVIERQRRGPFSDSIDLSHRVDGIGEEIAKKIDALVHYRVRPATDSSMELPDHLRSLIARIGSSAGDGLVTILEGAASKSGQRAAHRWFENRRAKLPDTTLEAEEIELIRGSSYYYAVIEFFDNAVSSIDVAMFHMAFPADTHPTRDILDALTNAQQRGVTIRILTDQDRAQDPYRSNAINRRAIAHLTAHNVSVRVDSPENLLHSKFAVIDDEVVILGSHNWSAGSYFHYDDISVAIKSEQSANSMTERFNQLWSVSNSL